MGSPPRVLVVVEESHSPQGQSSWLGPLSLQKHRHHCPCPGARQPRPASLARNRVGDEIPVVSAVFVGKSARFRGFLRVARDVYW